MKYLILNYVQPDEYASEDDDRRAAQGSVWGPYIKALEEAGVMVSGSALHPASTSTTVRVREGQRDIQDGPYADTKEQIGGFFVIEAPNLDVAMEWAAKNPAASSGAVEVRPVMF